MMKLPQCPSCGLHVNHGELHQAPRDFFVQMNKEYGIASNRLYKKVEADNWDFREADRWAQLFLKY